MKKSLLLSIFFVLLIKANGQGFTHPCMTVNQAEINAIKLKVQNNQEPWKSAYQDVLSMANSMLSQGPFYNNIFCNNDLNPTDSSKLLGGGKNCNNYVRGYYVFLGHALSNLAMASHISGDDKYAKHGVYLVDEFFFKKYPIIPRYTIDVGPTSSFISIIEAIDLLWPYMTTEQKTNFKTWHQRYLNSLVSNLKLVNYELTQAGTNRATWMHATIMACGMICDNVTAVTKMAKSYTLRKVSSEGQLLDVKPAGELVGEEDILSKQYMYEHFTLCAMNHILEMARHNGIDLYSSEEVNGKSKYERYMDYYAAAYWNPKTETSAGYKERTSEEYRFQRRHYFELANRYLAKDSYMKIINHYNGRPINIFKMTSAANADKIWSNEAESDAFIKEASFGPATLLCARGALEFCSYDRTGKKVSVIGDGSIIPENQSPSISITSPANNTSFTEGANIAISANATDIDGTISKVEFFNGTTKLGEDLTSPYGYTWTNVQAGSYSITAKATDNENATSISSAISVVVNNPNSATQNIALKKPVASDSQLSSSYPASNAVDGNNSDNASRWISANTAWPHWLEVDLQGTFEIEQIKFWVGYNGYTNGIGYNFEYWNGTAWIKIIDKPTNTNPVVNETFTKVTTTKVRLNGLSGVDNILRLYELEVYGVPVSSNSLPVVAITSPALGTSFNIGNTISITANASDSDGTISKVEFYAGSQLLGEDNTTPYTFNWSNFLAGSYTLYAKAYDNAGGTKTSAGVPVTINENTVVTSNLALLKPVIASAEPESQNPAENVVDGNSSSNWTAQNYPQYIEVDLLDVFDVNKIEIMPYNNRAYQFKVEGKYDTASSFQTLIDATANTEGGMVISKSFLKQQVRYVRLTITGCTGTNCSLKDWINLSEFMVYGDTIYKNPVVTSNLALLKPVIASAEPESQNPAENVVDGNSSSNWTAQNYPQYIEVDLLAVFDVNKIEIMPYNNRAYQFKVEGKNDVASSFQTLIDATANTEGGMVISKSFPKQQVRYVRLTITGCTGSNCSSKNWINLLEFMVYGDTINESLIKALTGQKEISNGTLAIYPNPCNNRLNITINNTEKNNYCIKNLNGLSVAEGRLKDGYIDVSSLKAGLYFLLIDGTILKFVKK